MAMPLTSARFLLPPGVRRSLHQFLTRSLTPAYYSFTWRARSPFSREIIQLGRKRPRQLRELDQFPELRGSAWKGLEGIGYKLIRHFRPKVVVELGTHMGLSALAMGLALRELGEGGQLFAVDSTPPTCKDLPCRLKFRHDTMDDLESRTLRCRRSVGGLTINDKDGPNGPSDAPQTRPHGDRAVRRWAACPPPASPAPASVAGIGGLQTNFFLAENLHLLRDCTAVVD